MFNFDVLEFVNSAAPRGRRIYTDDDGNKVLSYEFSQSMLDDVHEAALKILFEYLDLSL